MATDKFIPPLVFSVHGIRTKALWQKSLSETLKGFTIIHTPFSFGYYNVFRFLLKPSNEKMVDRFYEFYCKTISDPKYQIDTENYQKRPSIIVHSFGSYIVAYCMLKYQDVKFDKIILCGSILPRTFEWATLFLRDQVNHVQNEYGLKDIWTKLVGRFVKRTGDSGTFGFHVSSLYIKQTRFDYFTHSDYFNGQHVTKFWLPFLQKQPFNLGIKHGHDFEDVAEFSKVLDFTGTVIDKKCYGELPHYNEVEIPRGLSLKWIKINPDIYTFLFDQRTNEVKGYINAMPIEDNIFESIKEGKLPDDEITDEHIIPFLKNQKLKMYLMSIAIDPQARNVNEGLLNMAFERLMNGFINKLIYYYTNSNIKVSQFLAVGWTNEGRRLCKILGMTMIGNDEFGNPIYLLDLENEDLPKKEHLIESIKKLIEVYKQYPIFE